MKANKRVRDLARRSPFRLIATRSDGSRRGTTTYPYGKLPECKDGMREQPKLRNIDVYFRGKKCEI